MKIRNYAITVSKTLGSATVGALAGGYLYLRSRGKTDDELDAGALKLISLLRNALDTEEEDHIEEEEWPSFTCENCREYGYGYVLRNEVWDEALGEEDIGRLCLWCCEARLGRKLTADDFTRVPLNAPILYVLGLPQPTYAGMDESSP